MVGSTDCVEHAAGRERQGAGQLPGPDHGQQQEAYRGAHQQPQVDTPAAARVVVAGMGDQRVGRQGQQLVEQEQRQHVGRQRDAHGRRDGDGEGDIETGLVVLVVGAHVADGIHRGDRPQEAGHQGEQHAQRLRRQRQGQSRQGLGQHQGRRRLRIHLPHQRHHQPEQQQAGQHGHGLAHVGPAGRRQDGGTASSGTRGMRASSCMLFTRHLR